MATLTVPSQYETITDAVLAAAPGDTILIAASYDGFEEVFVEVDNLTFNAPASVQGIVIYTQGGIKVTLAGSAEIQVFGDNSDDIITGNVAANDLADSIDGLGYDNDTIDGGAGNDTIRSYGGIDTLKGGSGDDTFRLFNFNGEDTPAGGTVDGGAGVDTVVSGDLGVRTFTTVEVLDSFFIRGSVGQLSSFATITDSDTPTSQIIIDLNGAGGTLNLATKVAAGHSVAVDASLVTSAVTLTGTALADDLADGFDTAFNDTFDGGGGADTIRSYGGNDALKGGAGTDTFYLFDRYDDFLDEEVPSGGTVDGGTEIDTVVTGDLGTRTFVNVEVLDSARIEGSVAQLSSFTTITDSDDPTGEIDIDLTGAGGTLNLATKVAAGRSVDVSMFGVTSGINLTATAAADVISDSEFNDTIDGGAGADAIDVFNGGIDTLKGGAGNDTFYLSGVDGGGTVDGGADTDTVIGRLGTRTFTNVEVLDSAGGFVDGSIAQIGAFATITDSESPGGQIEITLAGAGGTLNLSTKITGPRSVYVDALNVTSAVTLTGTANADVFLDSSFNDTIDAGAGADTIYSDGGIDTLKGGAGNDTFQLSGNAGGGTVDGGADTDTVIGDLGTRTFTNVEVLDSDGAFVRGSVAQIGAFATITNSQSPSGQIDIELTGAGGTLNLATKIAAAQSVAVNALAATSGVTVTATGNADTLTGSASNDTLDGGAGADTILGTRGAADALKGGAGNDTFVLNAYTGAFGFGGTLDGGTDTDTVLGNNLGNYVFSNVEVLDTPSVKATASQLSSFAKITSSADDPFNEDDQISVNLVGAGGTIDFSTRVTGTESVYVYAIAATAGVKVTGTANADNMFGTKYADTFDGGAGDDFIQSRGGLDTLKGGAGNDRFAIQGSSGSVDGGTNTDTVFANDLGKYTFTNVEVLDTAFVKANAAQLSSFATITDSESENSDIQVYLTGAGGTLDFSTRIVGDNALDFDAAKSTNDVSVIGSNRDDTIWGSSFDDTLNGGGGKDVLAGGLGDDIFVTNGDDTLVEAANSGFDTVNSSATLTLGKNFENLTLTGAGVINGTGNALANTLVGNDKANILTGGLGNDTLRGNAGADKFVFAGGFGASNVDHIEDFVSKSDKMNLTKAGMFTNLTAGQALVSTQFKDITSPTTTIDGDDYIQYDRNTGSVYYDADGSGSTAKVLFAVLDTKPALVFGDFFVV